MHWHKNPKQSFFLAPDLTPFYIERPPHEKRIIERLKKKQHVIISGTAGVGKTTLAISICHKLQNEFPGGILWFRLDLKNIEEILSDCAHLYDKNIDSAKQLKIKINVVAEIIANKKVLLVLDNVESIEDISLLIKHPALKKIPILITTRQTPPNTTMYIAKLAGFTDSEVIVFSQKILGLSYIAENLEKILLLSKLLGGLPLLVNVFVKHLFSASLDIDKYITELKKKKISLNDIWYDEKNLLASLSVSFSKLSDRQKLFLTTLGAFDGFDFSYHTVAYANTTSPEKALTLLHELESMAFVERSTHGRFRLHPIIKLFLRGKPIHKEIYIRLSEYYVLFLKKGGRGNSMFYPSVYQKIDNILGVFNACCKKKLYEQVVRLWEYISIFLWDTGQWFTLEKTGKQMCSASTVKNDRRRLALCLVYQMGWLYFWQGNIEEADTVIKQGLVMGTELNDDLIVALGKQRLGMIRQEQNNLAEAEQLLNEALNLFTKNKQTPHIVNTLLYLGHVYRKKEDVEKTLYYYKQSLNEGKNLKEHAGIAIALYYLGELYLEKNNLTKAENYLKRSLAIDIKRGRRSGIPWNKHCLGKIAFLRGNKEQAYNLLKEAKKAYANLGMTSRVKLVNEDLGLMRR